MTNIRDYVRSDDDDDDDVILSTIYVWTMRVCIRIYSEEGTRSSAEGIFYFFTSS